MIRLLPDDDEEDEEDLVNAFKTQHECPGCQENIGYTDEIFLLELCEAAQDGGQIITQPLLNSEGDYEHPPILMHLECWEQLLEVIWDETADQPPADCENGILLCYGCKSTIAAFEPFASCVFGEVRRSRRCPNGEPADTVHRIGEMRPICAACLTYVVEEYLDEWEDFIRDLLQQNNTDEDEEEESE